MKDCKCGRIPPCYARQKFRIHEELEKMPRVAPLSEETAQETIKTLEDFSKSLEAELKACELINLIYEDIEKSIKSNDMEEKKTKKMTKAEAFEYLKGKKVRTCGEPRLLEKKLMECGYRWMRGVTWENDDYEDFWAYFMGYDGLITFVDIECSDYYECHDFEDISADDILSIEIVGDEPLDKWDDFARRVAKIQETLEDDEVCIITKGNFLTMTK